jgi:hypothetical protein
MFKETALPSNQATAESYNSDNVQLKYSKVNAVEDRGQRERGSVGGSPLVRGFTQFANE